MDRFAARRRKWKARQRRNLPQLPSLTQRYGAPPFSVLDASGWRERHREWRSQGVKGDRGRDPNLLRFSKAARKGSGTSTFPPALCEIAYTKTH
jgi:hypothetical protein